MTPLDQPPPIICSIVKQEGHERVQLRGRLVGRETAKGTFSLRVEKSGPSGSSTIAQSGTFSTAPNQEKLVGLASFNMEPSAHYKAELSLRVGNQVYKCESREGESR
jgi:hypothetical protein